ncbi:MAG: glutamate--cysteine ligase [Alphaproteobacteria bacterium]
MAIIQGLDDVATYFHQGCKSPDSLAIGTEWERILYDGETFTRLNYSQICKTFDFFQADGWQPVWEGNNRIALKKDGNSISLEPGGQLELSAKTFASMQEVADSLSAFDALLSQCAQEHNFILTSFGFDPVSSRDEVTTMPKQRYGIMTKYMQQVGTLGLDMMHRTATVQANLDYTSEEDFIRKMRVALGLSPIIAALFANSPAHGYKDYRAHIWHHTDNDRCGILPFAFEDGFGFERYAAYLLDVPMYFVIRDGQYIDMAGQSFQDFLAGKLPGLAEERPSLTDLEDHMSTAFPEVRLKQFLETRSADSGPLHHAIAIPALWAGILYNQDVLNLQYDRVMDWTQEDRTFMWQTLPKAGLDLEFRGQPLWTIAEQVFEALEPSTHLNYLKQIIESRQTLGDKMVSIFSKDKKAILAATNEALPHNQRQSFCL